MNIKFTILIAIIISACGVNQAPCTDPHQTVYACALNAVDNLTCGGGYAQALSLHVILTKTETRTFFGLVNARGEISDCALDSAQILASCERAFICGNMTIDLKEAHDGDTLAGTAEFAIAGCPDRVAYGIVCAVSPVPQ